MPWSYFIALHNFPLYSFNTSLFFKYNNSWFSNLYYLCSIIPLVWLYCFPFLDWKFGIKLHYPYCFVFVYFLFFSVSQKTQLCVKFYRNISMSTKTCGHYICCWFVFFNYIIFAWFVKTKNYMLMECLMFHIFIHG